MNVTRLAHRTTLSRFLMQERRPHLSPSGDLDALILHIASACKSIAKTLACGALGAIPGNAAAGIAQGETLSNDMPADDIFIRAGEWGGLRAGMVAKDPQTPHMIPASRPGGRYLLAFEPLDGPSNLGVNVSVGSIFSILRAPHPGGDALEALFLQPGTQQVCAGYAIYGPSLMLVITVGNGVHGFTLEPQFGEFILTHPDLTIPEAANELSIDASDSRFWEPAVKRYVGECLAGQPGPRGKDFSTRWTASLVAETHRILMRGGVFLHPLDATDPGRPGRQRLLYEANPIAFIVEQAGGRASTGRERMLEVMPRELQQRIGLVFGAREEVERVERYHRDHSQREHDAPLFGARGLFRVSV